jgi:cell division septum initiation protein DivIVA
MEAMRLRQTIGEIVEEDDAPITILGPSYRDTGIAPAVTVLADTIHTVADSQQLLLGSQQANRELLTVVLQDNFNLKEENVKLRDRMLELERDLVEMRRIEDQRRMRLEARLRQLEERFFPPRTQNPQEKQEERPGCIGQFFSPIP